MADETTFELTINGQVFRCQRGYTMRVLRAETEAGPMPSVDGEQSDEQRFRAVLLWQSAFLRAYLNVPQEFIDSCPVHEVMAATAEILKEAANDPFVQNAKRRAQQTEAATEPPTTGS